jgi:hypothetical protein
MHLPRGKRFDQRRTCQVVRTLTSARKGDRFTLSELDAPISANGMSRLSLVEADERSWWAARFAPQFTRRPMTAFVYVRRKQIARWGLTCSASFDFCLQPE